MHCLIMLDPVEPEMVVPTKHDVLFGRGRGPMHHEGNIQLHKIVAEHRKRYLISKRKQKAKIALEVIHEIHSLGGRFLQRLGKTSFYELSSPYDARQKVSHLLREPPSMLVTKKMLPTKMPPQIKIPNVSSPKMSPAFNELYLKQQEIFTEMVKQQELFNKL
mmetsp:Transcript_24091/g.33669  ORF Transcript_24091/g.33669 Transcript_24091/m.33669 type:complete len:162 (+) Transcript_24091:200-685(+)